MGRYGEIPDAIAYGRWYRKSCPSLTVDEFTDYSRRNSIRKEIRLPPGLQGVAAAGTQLRNAGCACTILRRCACTTPWGGYGATAIGTSPRRRAVADIKR
jgi:hypothetical protein